MLKKIKGLDQFTAHILVLFAGTSICNFLALLYQLLIAHNLSISDFATFNSLLALFTVFASPLGTLQTAVAKYCAQFMAHNQMEKIHFLLSDLLVKASILALATFLLLWIFSGYLVANLKIASAASFYFLAGSIALSWVSPVLAGGIQGMGKFVWLGWSPVVTGAIKVLLAWTLLMAGYRINGALAAFFFAACIAVVFFYIPLGKYISFGRHEKEYESKELFIFILPVAVSSLCTGLLVNMDMLLVKYYFPEHQAGVYALAQMIGKIFLFLTGAVAMVLLPKTSGLHSLKQDTLSTLRKSLLYVSGISLFALIAYNAFPGFTLKNTYR